MIPEHTAAALDSLDPDLAARLRFALEIDSLKFVLRRNSITDGSRRENTGEHSWHLALMAMVLAPYSAEPVDVGRVVEMLLVHDIVEIDAGDTFVYDTKAREQKEALETRAADRLFALIPGDDGVRLRARWNEFEASETPEARFAHSIDRIAPLLLNHANRGELWQEYGITESQVLEMNARIETGSPDLWNAARTLLGDAAENGWFAEQAYADVVPDGAAAGFQWWGPHSRARRSAGILLAGVATICATYVMVGVFAIVVAVRIVQVGSEHADTWPLGPVATAALVVALVIILAAVIAGAASETLAARAIRIAGARPLSAAEAAHTKIPVESFAVGVGFTPPAVWVVDDPVPNAFAAGRRRACAVCLTTGALDLPPDQLEALCAQTITSVANRALPLTCAAADLVVVARRCTNAIWALVAVLLVSTVIGVPPLFAAALTVAIVLVVVCSVPLLIVADRAVRRLRNRSAQLADLDAVRVTNQPAGLARVLLAAAADTRTVASRWEIAQLWFDPDTARPGMRGWERQFHSWLGDFTEDGTEREPAARARRALLDRARVIVGLTSADSTLLRQLERAESA